MVLSLTNTKIIKKMEKLGNPPFQGGVHNWVQWRIIGENFQNIVFLRTMFSGTFCIAIELLSDILHIEVVFQSLRIVSLTILWQSWD